MSDLHHRNEKFLIDSDCDPELVLLLRKVGFRARSALKLRVPNDDVKLLKWAHPRGYIFVYHDKHRDAETKHAFYAEAYYGGGYLIRISGESGQEASFALGKILCHRPEWQRHFEFDSGECVLKPNACKFTPAAQLFERTKYALRIPFEDPATPLTERKPLPKAPRRPRRTPLEQGRLLEI